MLERIIKILQIPPSGCSRSFQSSDILTLLTRCRIRSLLGDDYAREESLAAGEHVEEIEQIATSLLAADLRVC